MSMYVRFKRKNQTVFMTCDANEAVKNVKAKLAKVTNTTADNIKLYHDGKAVDEEKTLTEHKIENDNIIQYVNKVTGSNDWEPLEKLETK